MKKNNLLTYYIVFVVFAVFITAEAFASMIVVTTTSDEASDSTYGASTGAGVSLREAIMQAANNPGDDDIFLNSGSTYTLTIAGRDEDNNLTGDIDISDSSGTVTIHGKNAIVQAGTNNSNGIDRMFHIVSGTVYINRLTLRYGLVTGSTWTESGGAVYNAATTTIKNCTFYDNSAEYAAGACSNQGNTLNLVQCTIYNNSSNYGGAAYNGMGCLLNMTNCTISNNTTTSSYSFLYDDGDANLMNITVYNSSSNNSLYRRNGSVTITNSLIEGALSISSNGVGVIYSGGYNIIGYVASGTFNQTTGDTVGTSGTPADIGINATLTNNGGPTNTHALLSGSSGRDTGTSSGAPLRDQRGYLRSSIDRGAFEYNGSASSAPTDINISNSSVADNSSSGTTVGTLSETDSDSGETYTFALVPGTGSTDNNSFYIDGNLLKTNEVFDYETQNSYSIRVWVDDGISTYEKQMTISVLDDTPTDIALDSSSITENCAINTTIGNFSTTDEDSPFTYSLVSGSGDTDNSSFTISGNQLKSNDSFDYETQSSYSIRVRTTDNSGSTYEEIFTISIIDQDETLFFIHPSSTQNKSQSISIPLTLNNFLNSDIEAIDLHIQYNPNVLTATGISLTGTVLENQNYLYEFNTSIPGTIYALFASSANIYIGTGLLLNLDFIAIGSYGQSSDITISTALFNNVSATTSDGIFTVAANSAPTITGITSQTIDEDSTLLHTITINDIETNPCDLTLTLVSSDETLIPANTITYTCTSGDYYLSITPLTNQSGSVTITITASDDGNLSSIEALEITITEINDAPEMSFIPDQITDEDIAINSIAFTVTDVENAPCSLNITLTSSDQSLVPDANISYTCNNNSYTISILPASNQSGSVTITVLVTDTGSLTATQSFELTVTTVNDAPVISIISDQTTNEDTAINSISFTATDEESSSCALSVTLSSSDQSLILDSNISYACDADNYTLTIIPETNQNGVALINVIVGDSGGLTSNTSFNMTITAVNDIPVFTSSPITSATQDIAYTYTITSSDVEGNAISYSIITKPDWLSIQYNYVNITTVAGTGTNGFSGDAGLATSAQLNSPRRVAVDSHGNIYISDRNNNRIRKVDISTGYISTFAGTSTAGYSGDGGLATNAQINTPLGIAIDSSDNIYFVHAGNDVIRRIDAITGIITTVVGNGTEGYAGDGGPATSAQLTNPYDVFIDNDNNIYITGDGDRVRKVDNATGNISTIAGTTSGYSGDGGPATSAQLYNPDGIAVDSSGNIYIADSNGNRIRKIDASTGIITTIAGDGTTGYSGDGGPASSAVLHTPYDIELDSSGNIYFSDQANHAIRKIDAQTGIITTFAGTGSFGFSGDGGSPELAQLYSPIGLEIDLYGNIYIADLNNHRIRKVETSDFILSGTPQNSDVGSYTLTIEANDGTDTTIQSFTITVVNVNDAPIISLISDQTIDEDTATNPLNFTVTDADGDSLTVSASSSDLSLVAIENISFSGVGANRSVTITPTESEFGVATITISVSDGSLTATTVFDLTVTAINDPPVISTIAGQITNEEVSLEALQIYVTDLETAGCSLSITFASSDINLVSIENISYSCNAGIFYVSVTPTTDQSGSVNLTITVEDPEGLTACQSFSLTVNDINDVPLISSIADQTTLEDIATGIISFTATDIETSGCNMTLTMTSSDQSLVPDDYLLSICNSNQYSIVATPAQDQYGTVTISLTIADAGGLAANTSFNLTITDVDDSAFMWADNQAADVVLGQSDFISNGPGATASTLQNPVALAIDPTTGKIFISDRENNRVLRFSTVAAANSGSSAEAVLGQSDFTSVQANRGGSVAANTMYNTNGLFVDSFGRLWVSDRGNNRILRFDNASSKPSGADADGVLGQPNFTTNSAGTAQNTMNEPHSVWCDPAGRLWVGDFSNHRVLRFDNAASKANGANADGVLGQSDFNSATPGLSQNTFNNPVGVFVNNADCLFVSEQPNKRILGFDNASSKSNGANADRVYGQSDFTSNTSLTSDATIDESLHGVMDHTGRLYVTALNRVLIFNDVMNKSNGASADNVLGQPDFTSSTANNGGISERTLNSPFFLFFDKNNHQLWVAEYFNNRVKRYSMMIKTPPSMSLINDSTMDEDTISNTISFTVTDTNEQALTISYISSDTSLISSSGINFSGDQVSTNGSAYTVTTTAIATTVTLTVTPEINQFGTTDILIMVTDPDGMTATQSFTLTVTTVNDQPVIGGIVGQTTTEDFAFNAMSLTITDIEDTSPCNMDITITSSDTTIIPNENISYTCNSNTYTLTITPASDKNGVVTISFKVTDSGALTAIRSFDLTITAVNDAPILANPISNRIATEGTDYTFTFAVNTFTDVDSGDTLTYTAIQSNGSALPLWLSFDSATRTFSGFPTNSDVGMITITITATDGSAQSITDTFELNVTNTNTSPVLDNPIADQTISEDVPYSFTFASNTFSDDDVAFGDTISYSATLADGSSLPSWLTFDVNNRNFSGTPLNADVGMITITVTAEDTLNETATDSFYLTVVNVNDAPTITNINDQTINEDNIAGPISFNIDDVDDYTLTITKDSSNTSLLPLTSIDHTCISNSCTLTLTPTTNENGTAIVSVTVSDPQNLTAISVFYLTVSSINDTPVMTSISGQTINEDSIVSGLSLTVTDIEDAPCSMDITMTSSDFALLPNQNITYTCSAGIYFFNITPVADQSGVASISITVTDSQGTTTSTYFDLTVNPINDIPVLDNPIADQTATEEVYYSLTLAANTFSDVDIAYGDSISYTATLAGGSPLPSWLTFDDTSQTFSGTPLNADVGMITITVTAEDLSNETATDSFYLTVVNINDAPEISGTYDYTMTYNTTASILFYVSDPDDTSLTVSSMSSDTGLLADEFIEISGTTSTRSLTITPTVYEIGSVTITLTAEDPEGLTTQSSFVVNVMPELHVSDNYIPIIKPINSLTISEDSTGTTNFTAIDIEDTSCSLNVSIESSDTTLLPNENISYTCESDNYTITAVPASDQNGLATITVLVTDSASLTAVRSFDLTVTAVNDPPTLGTLTGQTIDEDTILQISLTASDTETVDCNNLSISIVSSDTSLIPNENISYTCNAGSLYLSLTPANNLSGMTSITISIADPEGLTDMTSFDVTVNSVNDSPVLSSISGQVLDEDTSISGISLTVSDIEDAPCSLSFAVASTDTTLIPNENITYTCNAGIYQLAITPVADGNGTATVIITSIDSQGLTASTSFNLTVNEINDAPILANPVSDQIATEGLAYSFTFNDNVFLDVDVTDTLTYTSTQSNGSSLPVWLSFNGSTRTFSGLPSNSDVGIFTITIIATDGSAQSITDTFTLTINNINDSPVLDNPIADQSISEDVAYSFTFASNTFRDDDAGDIISYTANLADGSMLPDWLAFDINNRTFSGTPLNADVGMITITVVASDTSSMTATDSFYLTVVNVNDIPEITSINDQTINEDTIAGPMTFTVTDVDSSSLSVSAISSALTLVTQSNISISGTASARTVVITPTTNANGETVITLSVTDGDLTATTNFTMNVIPVNDIPVIDSIADQTINEDSMIDYITFSSSDIETNSCGLTISIISSNPSLLTDITYTCNNDNYTITAIPNADKNGVATITVTVTDNGALTASSIFDLTVTSINDTPTIGTISNQTLDEDTTLTGLNISITDIESSPCSMSISITSSDISLIPNENISYNCDSNDYTITVTPAADQNGFSTITIIVTDSGGITVSSSFDVTVNAVNDSPVISNPITNRLATEDIYYSYTFSIDTFTDVDTGETLSYSATQSDGSQLPLWLSFDSMSRTFSGLPTNSDTGTITITLRATDSNGEYATTDFILTVSPVNDVPIISSISDQTIDEDSIINTIYFTASDQETSTCGLILNIESSNPTLLTNISYQCNNNSYTLTAIPAVNQNGMATITITVTDSNSTTASTSFDLTVTPINDVPEISTISTQSMNEGTSLDVTLTANDIESSSLTVTGISSDQVLIPDANITIVNTNDLYTITITPAENQIGSTDITISVSDGTYLTDLTFSTIVNPVYYTIAGHISYYTDIAGSNMDGVSITLSGTHSYSLQTDAKGYYTFTTVRPGDYTLTASKSDGIVGLDIADAIKILSAAVKNITLTCYEQIAADTYLDGKIGAYDAAKLARYISGLIPCINESCIFWRFIPEALTNCETLSLTEIETVRNYTDLNADVTGQDFIGIGCGNISE